MYQGIVKWFNEAKGLGFIRNDEGGGLLVYYSTIHNGRYRTFREGQAVRFDTELDPRDRGLIRAVNVCLA